VQELATAAELRLPLAIVLWNNDALGEIEDSMARRGVPKVSVRPENPDFLALAAAFNCRAHRAISLEDFKQALGDAFTADRPTVIEVRQDADFLS
jgi:5-guanidino-2-oxopentanoate decarboxylase